VRVVNIHRPFFAKFRIKMNNKKYKESINLEEIYCTFLEEIYCALKLIGFSECVNDKGDIVYQFKYDYPNMGYSNYFSNLYILFDKHSTDIDIYIVCHNFQSELKLRELKSVEQFITEVDWTVLSGRAAWIYYTRGYSELCEAATKQRKKYFSKRNKMKTLKVDDRIKKIIQKEGLEHFPSNTDLKYKRKKILDMSWEELANALAVMIKKENKIKEQKKTEKFFKEIKIF